MDVFWAARQGPAGADLQVARAGCRSRCEMAYFAFFLFIFFIYSFFSPPSHIAVSCSAGHLPTFRQQLHKKSFFSWNLGPLLMCDLQQ